MTSLAVSPEPLVQGGSAAIQVTGGTAHATITVTIDAGEVPPAEQTVQIQLDENGNGPGEWEVASDWDLANFNAPGSTEITRLIVPAD